MISSFRSSESPLTIGGELFGGRSFWGGRGSLRKLGSFSFGKIFLGLEILGARGDFWERAVFVVRVLFDCAERLVGLREDFDVEEPVVLDLRAMS